MKALVIGGDGFIGKALVSALQRTGFSVESTSRHGDRPFDLLNMPESLPDADVIYICAAITRFIDCEANHDAYATNVDAPMAIGEAYKWKAGKVVYLSSEAVELALHTNYGMMKALAEMGLRAVCNPVIVRLSKVTPESLDSCCAFLLHLATQKPGIYRWSAPKPGEDFKDRKKFPIRMYAMPALR